MIILWYGSDICLAMHFLCNHTTFEWFYSGVWKCMTGSCEYGFFKLGFWHLGNSSHWQSWIFNILWFLLKCSNFHVENWCFSQQIPFEYGVSPLEDSQVPVNYTHIQMILKKSVIDWFKIKYSHFSHIFGAWLAFTCHTKSKVLSKIYTTRHSAPLSTCILN